MLENETIKTTYNLTKSLSPIVNTSYNSSTKKYNTLIFLLNYKVYKKKTVQ